MLCMRTPRVARLLCFSPDARVPLHAGRICSPCLRDDALWRSPPVSTDASRIPSWICLL